MMKIQHFFCLQKAESCSRSAGSFQGANTRVQGIHRSSFSSRQFPFVPAPGFSQDKEDLHRNVSEITKHWLFGLWETPALLRTDHPSVASEVFPFFTCTNMQLFPLCISSTPIPCALFSDLQCTSLPTLMAYCIRINAELILQY